MLAPMAGATDQAFREIAKDYGCDFLVSEMVSAKGLVYDNQRTKDLLAFSDKERPLAIQLFGNEPQTMAEAARRIADQVAPDMIDINMGCPTPKIVKNGDGAALLQDPDLAVRIVESVRQAVDIPVTVKLRLGWADGDLSALQLSPRLDAVGVHWITVHGRTRQQFYSGHADWDAIRAIKKQITVPLVANGDIRSPETAAEALRRTEADHIMIGRAALGNPWIFREIKTYLDTGVIPEMPTAHERVTVILRHLHRAAELKGELRAVFEMRAHVAWYFKHVPYSAEIRRRANHCKSVADYQRLLTSWQEANCVG